MRFDILTLFPEPVEAMMQSSILGRAQKKGLIEIHAHQIRDYTANRQNQVDDYPYGGGRGAILQCDPAVPVLVRRSATISARRCIRSFSLPCGTVCSIRKRQNRCNGSFENADSCLRAL